MSAFASLLTPHASRPRSVFITGTDTNVGKTVVTAAIVVALRQRNIALGVMKPVETGCEISDDHSDAGRLREIAGMAEPLELIAPYRFTAPLVPLAAAHEAGSKVDLAKIHEAYQTVAARYSHVLIEGIGGVRVPITEEGEVIDLIRALASQTVVVGRAALGGVNHAMLTVEALQRRDIPLLAVVLNSAGSAHAMQVTSTVSMLKQLAGVPVLGPLPRLRGMETDWNRTIGLLAQDVTIQRLADLVTAMP
jgi:dethiobiotin synthetase